MLAQAGNPLGAAAARKPLVALDRFQRSRDRSAFVIGVVKKFGDDRAGHLAVLISVLRVLLAVSLCSSLSPQSSVSCFADNPDFRARVQDSALKNIPLIGEQISVGELKGSIWGVVIGLAGAIWAGLRVVDAAQNAMNEIWDQPITSRPGFVRRRLRGC